jgi:hypothetical protein
MGSRLRSSRNDCGPLNLRCRLPPFRHTDVRQIGYTMGFELDWIFGIGHGAHTYRAHDLWTKTEAEE